MSDDPTREERRVDRARLRAEVDHEAELWENVDASDPTQVARALASLGARAGAKVAVLEHMNERVGKALTKLDGAVEALHELVPRAEMEDQLAQLRKDVDTDRERDRRAARWWLAGVVVVFAAVAALIGTAVWLNRADLARDQREDERFVRRSEAVAVCASTYPGDADAIHACVEARVPSNP